MVPRENKNNAYAKFGGTNKQYYRIFRNGLYNLIPRLQIVFVSTVSLGVEGGGGGKFPVSLIRGPPSGLA